MKFFTGLMLVFILLAGCAGEDDTIVNPPPGNANVIVRFFNTVPDGKTRQLVLESGYQTLPTAPGMFSPTVQAPSDSSFLEIYAGSEREYRSETRARFTRQSVYNVYAVAGVDATDQFDTVMLSNANRSLTTLPVAQVRAVNLIPDTTVRYDVRIGCPNGEKLSTASVQFRTATLYREMPPGPSVFSISRTTASGSELIGTYQCVLNEFTPYSIMIYALAGVEEPQFMLFDESDFTAEASRVFVPVTATDADIRVANVSTAQATVSVRRTGQTLEADLPPDQLGAYVSVATCETEAADVFDLSFGDGRVAVDSTSLTVRGTYTIVAAEDSVGDAAMVVIPPTPTVFGAGGLARIRVVSATNYTGGVGVSIGGRTDVDGTNGVSTGLTLTSSIRFDEVSDVSIIDPGEVPLTVTTASTPSTVLAVRRVQLEPDRSYLLLLSDAEDGTIRMFLSDESDTPGSMNETEHAALVRWVNGAPQTDFATTSIGTIIQNAQVFYRNSLATNLAIGSTTIVANGTTFSLDAVEDIRSLVVYTVRNGTETMFAVSTPPLEQNPAFSQRRVINATGDVDLVSVAYDTLYKKDPDDPNVPHVARQVPYGQASPVHTLDREVRGSMFVYDYSTREELYNLPIDLGPLGNSYSLIVVGTKEEGYEVIVLQEF